MSVNVTGTAQLTVLDSTCQSCGLAGNLRNNGLFFRPSGVCCGTYPRGGTALTGHANEPSWSAMVTLLTVRGSVQRRLR